MHNVNVVTAIKTTVDHMLGWPGPGHSQPVEYGFVFYACCWSYVFFSLFQSVAPSHDRITIHISVTWFGLARSASSQPPATIVQWNNNKWNHETSHITDSRLLIKHFTRWSCTCELVLLRTAVSAPATYTIWSAAALESPAIQWPASNIQRRSTQQQQNVVHAIWKRS